METENLSARALTMRAGKRWLPLIVMVAAFIVLTQYSKISAVDPVMCGAALEAEAAEAVMLSASWCGYCRRARGYFAAEGINYCEYDIEQTSRGAELYRQSRFGAIPVIFIGDETFVGFNREQVARSLSNLGRSIR